MSDRGPRGGLGSLRYGVWGCCAPTSSGHQAGPWHSSSSEPTVGLPVLLLRGPCRPHVLSQRARWRGDASLARSGVPGDV